MSRYRGPRLKKIRRLGALPGLTRKTPKSGRFHKRWDQPVNRKLLIFHPCEIVNFVPKVYFEYTELV